MKPASPAKILAILGILFIPALFYLLISSGTNNFRTLEIFGPKEVGSSRIVEGKTISDTIYHTIPPFSFTDQFGRIFTDSMVSGKVYVASFFYTTCPENCQKVNNLLEEVQAEFGDSTSLILLSFTTDPAHDSVPALAEYANKHMAIKDKWYFLTGEKSQLAKLARDGYFLRAVPDTRKNSTPNHSEQLVLIDKDKRIRGYYDGDEFMEIKRLKDEIQVLLWEYQNK